MSAVQRSSMTFFRVITRERSSVLESITRTVEVSIGF